MSKTALALAVMMLLAPGAYAAPALALNPYEARVDLGSRNAVDELVFARLEQCNVQPAALCSDVVFVRRAYLDIIGTLPSGYEAREFILDRSAGKRRALIDRLLARDEFADYWAMKWSDVLRIKAEFPIRVQLIPPPPRPRAARTRRRRPRATARSA